MREISILLLSLALISLSTPALFPSTGLTSTISLRDRFGQSNGCIDRNLSPFHLSNTNPNPSERYEATTEYTNPQGISKLLIVIVIRVGDWVIVIIIHAMKTGGNSGTPGLTEESKVQFRLPDPTKSLKLQ